MEELVDALLEHHLLPVVVPEFKASLISFLKFLGFFLSGSYKILNL